MKKITLLLTVFIIQSTFAQQPYYNGVDLSLTGQDLFFELQSKIDNASSTFSYGDVRDTMKITDENPDATNDVLLIYGYDDTGSCTTDRTRDKDDFGGSTCEFNRETCFLHGLMQIHLWEAQIIVLRVLPQTRITYALVINK